MLESECLINEITVSKQIKTEQAKFSLFRLKFQLFIF